MKFKLNFTHQFFIFLILVSLLPIFLISWIFYQDISHKFNERINHLLMLGALVADDTYHNDLETLEVSNRQAAILTFSQLYAEYAAKPSTKITKLQSKLLSFQKIQRLDLLSLYGKNKTLVCSGNNIVQLSPTSSLITQALEGKTVSGVERVYNPKDQHYRLIYLSASPLFSANSMNKKEQPIGVLISGYSMSQHFSFKDIVQIFPQLDIRILVKTPSGTRLRSTLNSTLKNLTSEQLDIILKKPQYIRNKKFYGFFNESSSGEIYRSLAFPLRDASQTAVGYIIVSTSESDILQLQHKNILYVFGFLILAGILVLFTAYIFNRSFIKPIEELAKVSELVTQGNLNIRVTEPQRIEKVQYMMSNFNKMLSQLEEDHLIRSTFVSTLTHDLRTPLFAQARVLEAINKVRLRFDNENILIKMLESLQKGNSQLIEMVNKLLEAYQYESGYINVYPEKILLPELVASCLEDLLPLASQKSIKIQNNIPANFEVYADPEQLQRVFQNLVSNAIANIQTHKHIIITAFKKENLSIIHVADNGPGISQEVLPHLFQRYFTGHTKQKIGSGLGLFICRMIVELHQGTIFAESSPNQGTTFTICLPEHQ